jgi:signal transduction histidine kinase
MVESKISKELQALEKELKILSSHTLPVPTRSAIETTRKKLLEVEQHITQDSGQEHLGALYAVSNSLGLSLKLEDVLTQVMDAVIQLTGAERGFLTLIDPDTGNLDLRAARNIEQETLQKKDLKISRTVVQSVIHNGEGVLTTDAQTDPRFSKHDSVIHLSLRSILCSPLNTRGRTIGVIYVENRAQSGMFTKDDLDLLNAFAVQAAIAIENARLYTQTDQALNDRITQLETLGQIDRQLSENLDLSRIFEITRKWAIIGTGGTASWITLTEEETGQQKLAAGDLNDDIPIPDNHLIKNMSADLESKWISQDENQTKYIITPLIHARELMGLIIIAHPSVEANQATQFLVRLAARAAPAIENARLYKAVQSANESKSQFVSIVTHELRIPLTSIKGYTDLIYQGTVGALNTKQSEFIEVIRSNVNRMSNLISDLSDISRIERGILKLEMEFIPLQHLIDETVDRLRQNIEEKDQDLEINIPMALPKVYADPNRLVQILTNLLSNAWKYTPVGGKISVTASLLGSQIVVAIIDSGIGISPEDQEKLFTQFYRSDSLDVRKQSGWGLGLFATRQLVELMGGTIGMSSETNQGSTFWFTLPTTKPKSLVFAE